MAETTAEKTNEKKRIAIALQGGGAHGAFTWGALDRLLEDGRFIIEGLTGTSAGGMNAVATAQGLIRGGNEQARKELRNFWTRISESGENSPIKRGLIDKIQQRYTMNQSPGFIMLDYLMRLLSPYELNPFNVNPLKDVVEACFDLEPLRKNQKVKVFLCATHVFSGKLKVFKTEELTPECLLASACLPFLHHAVEVNGEYYWDGGYIGNPVLFPLIYECQTPDLMIIQLNPMNRPVLPRTTREISDRLNEITCNATLVREMRSIGFITELIDKGIIKDPSIKRLRLHLIQDEVRFLDLGFSSKLNSEMDFLSYLFDAGYRAADHWIKENYDKCGKESTAKVLEHYM